MRIYVKVNCSNLLPLCEFLPFLRVLIGSFFSSYSLPVFSCLRVLLSTSRVIRTVQVVCYSRTHDMLHSFLLMLLILIIPEKLFPKFDDEASSIKLWSSHYYVCSCSGDSSLSDLMFGGGAAHSARALSSSSKVASSMPSLRANCFVFWGMTPNANISILAVVQLNRLVCKLATARLSTPRSLPEIGSASLLAAWQNRIAHGF